MSLQTAQLGGLPSMNLARYVPEHIPIEPAWHKALTAFLVNTAGSTGKDLVSNALSRDYSEQARALGLPGAPTTDQSFASQVLHGPQWDQTALREGIREKSAETRAAAQDKRLEETLGLQRSELEALNKYREGELAQRQAEQGLRESERKDMADYRNREIQERQADRLSRVQESQDRINTEIMLHKMGLDPTQNPGLAAEIQLKLQEARTSAIRSDPRFEGQAWVEKMRQLMGEELFNKWRQSFAQQPANNSDQVNFHSNSPTPTVPGSAPVGTQSVGPQAPSAGGGQIPATTPYTQPASVPSFGTSQRDATMAPLLAPAAGTSQQMGQRQQMEAAPVEQTERGYPITQPQALMQHVGETMAPSDLLSLVRPPQTPNSPTAIQPSTNSAQIPSITLDPETMARAAEYLRRLQAAGMGGIPNQMGAGTSFG